MCVQFLRLRCSWCCWQCVVCFLDVADSVWCVFWMLLTVCGVFSGCCWVCVVFAWCCRCFWLYCVFAVCWWLCVCCMLVTVCLLYVGDCVLCVCCMLVTVWCVCCMLVTVCCVFAVCWWLCVVCLLYVGDCVSMWGLLCVVCWPVVADCVCVDFRKTCSWVVDPSFHLMLVSVCAVFRKTVVGGWPLGVHLMLLTVRVFKKTQSWMVDPLVFAWCCWQCVCVLCSGRHGHGWLTPQCSPASACWLGPWGRRWQPMSRSCWSPCLPQGSGGSFFYWVHIPQKSMVHLHVHSRVQSVFSPLSLFMFFSTEFTSCILCPWWLIFAPPMCLQPW